MRKIIAYSIILMLSLSGCKSQQFNVASLSGTFDGAAGKEYKLKNPLHYYVLLELNPDGTCSLNKSFDLIRFSCDGEWTVLDNNFIEIKCNNNPEVDEVIKALMAGGYIEGIRMVKILNKNKLKLGTTVLKRKKRKK